MDGSRNKKYAGMIATTPVWIQTLALVLSINSCPSQIVVLQVQCGKKARKLAPVLLLSMPRSQLQEYSTKITTDLIDHLHSLNVPSFIPLKVHVQLLFLLRCMAVQLHNSKLSSSELD